MSSAEEWKDYKLKQLEHLRAQTFTFAQYTAPNPEWDHDHCEGCWSKFADFEAPEVLHSGYVTVFEIDEESATVPELIQQAREAGREVLAKPDDRQWVCQDCFKAFRAILDWKVISGT